MQPSPEEIILSFDVFSGDDSQARTFKNKMVLTRSPHECHNCADTIPAGSRCRSLVQSWEGQMGSFWFCPACCAAMIVEWEGDSENMPFEDRCQVHKNMW